MAKLTLRGTKAPTELRLFKPGRNPTLLNVPGGALFYDPKRARELTKLQRRTDGRDRLHIDLAHHSVDGNHATVEANKAFGWFTVEHRADGVWATRIDWTDEGRRLVESKAFRYYSPTSYADGEDGNQVTTIHSIGLTNSPAKLNIRPLTLSATHKGKNMDDTTNDETKVQEADAPADDADTKEPLPLSEEDKDALIESLKAELDAANDRILELEERIDALSDEEEDDGDTEEETAKERTPADIVTALVAEGYVLATAAPRLLKLSVDVLSVRDRDLRSRPALLKGPTLKESKVVKTSTAEPTEDVTENRIYKLFTGKQA